MLSAQIQGPSRARGLLSAATQLPGSDALCQPRGSTAMSCKRRSPLRRHHYVNSRIQPPQGALVISDWRMPMSGARPNSVRALFRRALAGHPVVLGRLAATAATTALVAAAALA